MTVSIAVAGKGGTGKTMFSALTIKYLVESNRQPVLAIDADPSANLNLALGLQVRQTIGQIREDTLQQVTSGTYQSGVAKPDWFWYQVNDCLVEGDQIDLLTMGRPEGPGCYCAANNMLRHSVDRLGNDYPYIVIDNEAGMEHISRQTARDISLLLVLSDPNYRGLIAAEHIVKLADSLGTRIGRCYLILNNVGTDLPDAFMDRISNLTVPLLGTLPHDPAISECDLLGRPFVQLGESSLIYPAISQLVEKALISLT